MINYTEKTKNFKTFSSQWLDRMIKELHTDEEYHYEEIDVHPGDIVLDLGGNIGVFVTYALSKGAAKVYTVEAYPSHAKLLQENMKQFGDKVEVIPMAVSDTDRTDYLNFNFEDNTILDDVYKSRGWNSENNKTKVDVIGIKTLIKKYAIPRIDYLKVDIEGSEYPVFKGLSVAYLKNNVSRVACEYHWSYNGEANDIVDKLEKAGFETYYFETNPYNKIGKIYAINKKTK